MGIKSLIHSTILALKEEKIKPVIIPTDKEKLLNGKVALITGASSGIGFAIAKSFIASGAKVIIAGSNQKRLDKAINLISDRGGSRKYSN